MTERQQKYETRNDRIKPKIIHIASYGTDLQRIAAEVWLSVYWGQWPMMNGAQYMNRIEAALSGGLGLEEET